jgi:hypothetical protein
MSYQLSAVSSRPSAISPQYSPPALRFGIHEILFFILSDEVAAATEESKDTYSA